MDIRHLKCMVAVADSHGFKTAARQLHITQPALSVTIRQLEEETGEELFVRSSRVVHLTKHGEYFYQYARRILAQIEELQNHFHPDMAENGKIRIGSAKYSFIYFLKPYLSNMLLNYPDIDVETVLLPEEDLYSALESERVDLIYNVEAAANAAFHIIEVTATPLCVAMHKEDSQARLEGALDWQELNGQRFALHRKNSTGYVHQMLAGLLRRHHIRPSKIFWVDNAFDALLMVSAGRCMAFMPEYYSRFSDDIVTRPLMETVLTRHQIQWKKNSTSRPLKYFLESVREQSEEDG